MRRSLQCEQAFQSTAGQSMPADKASSGFSSGFRPEKLRPKTTRPLNLGCGTSWQLVCKAACEGDFEGLSESEGLEFAF